MHECDLLQCVQVWCARLDADGRSVILLFAHHTRLTNYPALELRKYGITVNCYAPGLIVTALSETLVDNLMSLLTKTEFVAHSEDNTEKSVDEQLAEHKKVRSITVLYFAVKLIASTRVQLIGLGPEDSAAFPEVIASMVNYIVKPEAYFVTGEQAEYLFSQHHLSAAV